MIVTGSTEGIQTVQVLRPAPGRYQLITNAQSGDYIITRDFIFIQAGLESPSSGLLRFGQNEVRVRLVDSSGQALPEMIVGHTTHDIDATRVIWDFFMAHPQP